jgi:hypothetical protein
MAVVAEVMALVAEVMAVVAEVVAAVTGGMAVAAGVVDVEGVVTFCRSCDCIVIVCSDTVCRGCLEFLVFSLFRVC